MPVIDLVICLLTGAALMGAGILIGQHQGWQETREILWDVAVAMAEQQRASHSMLRLIEGRELSEREYARLRRIEKGLRHERPWQARPDTSSTAPRERVPVTPAPMAATTAASTDEPATAQAGE